MRIRTSETSTGQIPVHRLVLLGLIVLMGVASLALFFVPRLGYRHSTLKTCFQNAEGLRPGAPVRVAGVNIGLVDTVEARPGQRDCPAAVEFTVNTLNQLGIPNDAVARIDHEGLLGGGFVEIDVAKATGPAIEDSAMLKSAELSHHASVEVVKSLIEAAATAKPGDAEAPKADQKPASK